MAFTYQELGLPSIGEFTVSAMRTHRHPLVRALGAFLSNKADYLDGDRFTVRFIRYLADYGAPAGNGVYDFGRIRIGSRPHMATGLTRRWDHGDGVERRIWEVAYVLPRVEAVQDWLAQRYGRRGGGRMAPYMLQQHYTFDLN